MTRRTRGWITIAAALFIASALTPEARAQTSGDRERARDLANRGYALFQEGNYEGARDAFVQAIARVRAPTILIMLARSQEKLGRLLEARALYREIVDTKLGDDAPSEFREANGRAKAALAALDPRIPRLLVSVTGAPLASVQATLNGTPLVVAKDEPVLRDPVEHTLVVSAKGRETVRRQIVLRERTDTRVKIDLLPIDDAPHPASDASHDPIEPPASAEEGSFAPAFLAFGGALAGVGVGAATGILAWQKTSDIEGSCVDGRCPAALRPEADDASTLATVSTASFIAGGALAATGIVLLAVRSRGDSEHAIDAAIGIGSIELRGRF